MLGLGAAEAMDVSASKQATATIRRIARLRHGRFPLYHPGPRRSLAIAQQLPRANADNLSLTADNPSEEHAGGFPVAAEDDQPVVGPKDLGKSVGPSSARRGVGADA